MGANSGHPAGGGAETIGAGVMDSGTGRLRRTLRGTPYTEAREYGLGRVYKPDARDMAHLMASHLVAVDVLPGYRYWTPGPLLDQGSTPTCVGHAWRQFLSASPVRTKGGPTAFEIYDEAQLRDDIPGVGYPGTTVRGGAEALRARGHLREYLWATSADEVLQWVLTHGPVVLGTRWSDGMFQPDREGFVWPTGGVVGGHAYTVIGANRARGVVRIVNSWGAGWGQRGRAWMALEVVEQLIREDGEACTTEEVTV